MHKIKYFFLATISIFLIGACSLNLFSPYETFNDEFKNGKKYIAEMDIAPEEYSEIHYAHTVIERTMTSNTEEVNIYFVVSRNSMSFNIENKAYIKVENQVFEVQIFEVTSEYKNKQETTSVTTSVTDSTGTKVTKSDHSENKTWINDKFKIALHSEVIEAIRKCNKFKIGLYFGPMPATFVFDRNRLVRIKKLLYAVD